MSFSAPPCAPLMPSPNARIPRMNDDIAFYRVKLRQDPNNAASHHYLAPLLLAQGNVLAALRHYRRAYQINPRDINSKNDLAIVLWRLGKSEAALAALCQVVAVDNDHFEGHVNLAVAYYEKGHYDIALKHAKKATQLRPRDPLSHRLLGHVLDEMGNSSRALHHRMIAIRRGENAAGTSDRMNHPQHLYTYKKVAAQLVIGKDRAQESGHAFMDAYRAMSGKRVELAHSERTREILHSCLR